MCETEVPPVRKLAGGHQIKCHLAEDILEKMEPVVALANDNGAPSKKAKKAAGKATRKADKKVAKNPSEKTAKKIAKKVTKKTAGKKAG